MNEKKFDFKGLMNHKPTTKISLTEKNKPNFDIMAEAFHKLFRR
jgi:hypothetical protein